MKFWILIILFIILNDKGDFYLSLLFLILRKLYLALLEYVLTYSPYSVNFIRATAQSSVPDTCVWWCGRGSERNFVIPASIVLQIRKYHVLTQAQGEEKYRDVYNAISLYLGMHDAIQTLDELDDYFFSEYFHSFIIYTNPPPLFLQFF